jgi:signal transduction histidine kinase
MARLFEPFFSTRPAGEGTGLGLALSRRIVVRHGGSIDVQSEPGQGTTVTVKLPAYDEPKQSAQPPSTNGRMGQGLEA